MEKLVLLKKNLPFILLPVLVVKFLFSPSYADAQAILVLSALMAYYRYLEENKKEPADVAYQRELAALKDNVREQKDQLNALKISASYRKL